MIYKKSCDNNFYIVDLGGSLKTKEKNMSENSDNIIWDYQLHYLSSAINAAEGVFNLLDCKLSPDLFIIGIPYKNVSEHPACIVIPEDEGKFSSISFSNIGEEAKHYHAIDNEKYMFHSHPYAQQTHECCGRCRVTSLTGEKVTSQICEGIITPFIHTVWTY